MAKQRAVRGVSLAVMVGAFAGCGSPLNETPEALRPFESEAELNRYVDAIREKQQSGTFDPFGWGSPSPTMTDEGGAASPEAPPPSNEEITNNQEGGVDEGGIVKNVGDSLVVLRKGRLYAANIAASGQPVQTDSIPVALNAELNDNVWYDELLVKGRLVIVIGYRYVTDVVGEADRKISRIHGATEVALFTLSDDGKFTRQRTRFFESNDYYSGENYASRLVDGKLILYMPYGAFGVVGGAVEASMPRHLDHKSGRTFVAKAPLFTWAEVMRPVVAPSQPALHSVLQCEIDAQFELACRGRALLGEWSRSSYVSPTHVFLWTNDYLYALAQSDLAVTAHAVKGFPRNQFSFKQEGDVLHVLATEAPTTETPTETARSGAGERILWLFSLPLSGFDLRAQQTLDATRSREVARLSSSTWISENRYAEGYFTVASTEYRQETTSNVLRVHHVASGATEQFDLGATRVTRLEALPGTGALIVGANDEALVLHPLKLVGGTVELRPSLSLPNVGESEGRSHAFFYKPAAMGGTFGLPVISDRSDGWWGSGASNVAFFHLDGGGALTLSGAVSAGTAAGGQCETSCIDWYGNTRPIFLGTRVFALMGSELQEATVSASAVSDLGTRLVFGF